MGHSEQEAVNEEETGKVLSHVGTRPLLQDGSWPETCLLARGVSFNLAATSGQLRSAASRYAFVKRRFATFG
jgi:hypothetical protein